MGTRNILNYLEKDGKTVHITVRIDKRLLLQIDRITDNRSELIRKAIIAYLKLLKFHKDLDQLIRNILDNNL